jgi:hypothetical protein
MDFLLRLSKVILFHTDGYSLATVAGVRVDVYVVDSKVKEGAMGR